MATTIQLQHPITIGEEVITELHLQDPHGSDLRASGAGKSDEEKTLILLSRLAGISPRAVDAMHGADVIRAGAAIAELLAGGSPPTGKIS